MNIVHLDYLCLAIV